MSLAVKYAEISRVIVRNLGWDPDNLTADEEQSIQDSIRRGLSDFYMPRKLAPDQPIHVWSFLQKDLVVNVTSGVGTITLPSDFSQLTDGLTFSAGSGLPPIALVGERDIRNLRSARNETGVPKYAAVAGKGNTTGATAYELHVYPTPDADFTLEGRYRFEPDEVDSSNINPLGGALHGDTIIMACLVASDKLINPEAGPSKYEERYQQLLAASIDQDRALQRPEGGVVWPTDFAEGSKLEVTKDYLLALIGNAMGYPADQQIWTHQQRSEATEVLRSGLRKFQSPPILPGRRTQHQWSFLQPISRMRLEAGKYVYPLPRDFAMMRGPLTYAPGALTLYPDIDLVGEEKIRHLLQFSDMTSRPTMAAVVSTRPGQDGHHAELWVYPSPDQNYDVLLRYSVNMVDLDGDQSLPVGGPPHSQTIIEACLAAAEAHAGREGIHSKLFLECLNSSISHDQLLSAPDSYGVNADNSDARRTPSWKDFHEYDSNIVTYNGESY